VQNSEVVCFYIFRMRIDVSLQSLCNRLGFRGAFAKSFFLWGKGFTLKQGREKKGDYFLGGMIMKKTSDLMHNIDEQVDRLNPLWNFFQKHFVTFSASLLTALSLLFLVRVFMSRTEVIATAIKEDLTTIEQCLERIDKECNILSIRVDNAMIDFLTVEKFVGSAVGCLNLAYPAKWKGPYLKQNPTLRERPYEIIKTKQGYFLIPGKGVKLPSGLVMGKDLTITFESNMTALLAAGGHLNFKGLVLAKRLKFIVGDWDSPFKQDSFEKVSSVLKEFHDAMPYAQRGDVQGKVGC